MTSKMIRYNKKSRTSHSSRDKGCFELMANDVKSEIVHQVQRCGKYSAHHKYITLTLQKKEGKRKQRSLGQFYMDMIKKWNNDTKQVEFWDGKDDEISSDESIEDARDDNKSRSNEGNNKSLVESQSLLLNKTLRDYRENDFDDINVESFFENSSESNEDDDDDEIQDTNIQKHLQTPDGEILFKTGDKWNDYLETSKICGMKTLKQYVREHRLLSLYGKAAKMNNKVLENEAEEKKHKQTRNDVKMYLSRKKNRTKNYGGVEDT